MKKDFKESFLNRDPALMNFLKWNTGLSDYKSVIDSRSEFQLDRKTLVLELNRQNDHLPDNAEVLKNIKTLENPTTFTVTAGHQLCMAGGPLFSFYKIITAIKLARAIEENTPSCKVVPVFWMASEDHDFLEVNFFQPGWLEKRVYEETFKGAVGRHVLQDSIRKVFDGLDEEWNSFYQPGVNFSEAFRQFIHFCFGRFGLIIIDGDSPALKNCFRGIISDEIYNQSCFQLVSETNSKLESGHYKVQANPREINFFYLHEDGFREAIEKGEMGFRLKESKKEFNSSQMDAEIELHPERFSPNVLMRPLYQSLVLPDIAFIGGWAELNYWAQLKTLFEKHDIFFPLIVPRFSAGLVRPSDAEDFLKCGLEITDLSLSISELNEKIASAYWEKEKLNNLLNTIQIDFDKIKSFVSAIDKSLEANIEAQKVKAMKPLEELMGKIRKSIMQRYPDNFQRAAFIQNKIQPQGKIQERELHFSAFATSAPKQLIEFIMDHCDPENPGHKWILFP